MAEARRRFRSFPRDWVEDAVHQAWSRILEKPGQFLGESFATLSAWLVAATRNALLDREKAAYNRLRVEHLQTNEDGEQVDLLSLVPNGVDVGQSVANSLDYLRLAEHVERILSEFDHTTASLLRAVFSEEPLVEAAAELGLDYEVAKKRVQRGRVKLADLLTAREKERGGVGGEDQ